MTDAVPTPVRYLADLFADALAAVKFPDVDADALAAAVARVDALAADATRIEEDLARARQAADAARDEAVRLAVRAHAYARVYAEDDEPLRTRLDAISLPRAKTRAATSGSSSLTAANSNTTAPPADAPAATSARKKKKSAADVDSTLFADAESEPAAAE